MQIAKDIIYVGVNDHEVDLFEGQFEVPLGMAYNSYVVKGAKTAVIDSVDRRFGEEWLGNVAKAAEGVDYLVVQHMEPDHSSSIDLFAKAYPNAKIVSSAPAFAMMKNYFGTDFAERRIVVKESDALDLGGHTLKFVAAPMVHWPEVIVTYDVESKSLFSADGFGKFGALDREDPEGWDCEARRYYFGIVGKFGAQVQALLKKASGLEIERILPLHGPIHDTPEMVAHVISQYSTWSSYGVETPGVFIAYTSVYGHTKAVAEKLAEMLKAKGCPKVAIADLAREDTYESVEDAFRYGRIVLATTTYNTGVFPFMREFIDHLVVRGYRNRKIGLVENGTWAPMAAKGMRAMFAGSEGIEFCPTVVTVKGAPTAETEKALEALAGEIMA
ncbi:MAG: FprA family A-type flavoprotein [Kiritimatiellae bacterium]|nr:FprA family A-type flavoprotein [Kiritimatiellia bacterium]